MPHSLSLLFRAATPGGLAKFLRYVYDELSAQWTESQYTLMVRGLMQAGEYDGALQLLDEMTDRGIEPHKRTYSPIITGLCDRVANEPVRERAEHYLSKALDFLTLCISDLHDDIEASQSMDVLRGCNAITPETEIAGRVVCEVLRLYRDQVG